MALVALGGASLGFAVYKLLGMEGVSQALAMTLGPPLVSILGMLHEVKKQERRDVK